MIERCDTCSNYGRCYICGECDEANMFEPFTLEEMFQIEADKKLPSNFKVFGEDGQLTPDAWKYYDAVGKTFFEDMDEFNKFFEATMKE